MIDNSELKNWVDESAKMCQPDKVVWIDGSAEEKKRLEELSKIKGEHKQASWGNQIRSYVLHPYKQVKDLRTEHVETNPEAVLDGGLDELIEKAFVLG